MDTESRPACGPAPPPLARIATAGWAIPRAVADRFPEEGSGLQRYAARFSAVEINTTFYKPHRQTTFERWATSTPDDFAFALKMPKAMTHERRLADCEGLIGLFLEQAAPLGRKLKALLVQLPPSLAFDPVVAGGFLAALRRAWPGPVACEPRHSTWFEAPADELLKQYTVAQAAADPARAPGAERPQGWTGFAYRRLHGSPQVYRSSYDEAYLAQLAEAVRADPPGSWCVFDNTTSGAAAVNALQLVERLGGG